MNDLLNPYIAGAPVVEADMFFGRQDVFGWIERSLMGKYIDHILVIHGQRRVGKTSILKQIPNHLPDQYLQVFFDLQGRTNTTLERFLWWLTREITRTLNRQYGLSLSAPDQAAFEADPEILFTHFLPEVQVALGEQVLLLTFDEFDTLQQPAIQESLARPVIQVLRRMMELEGISFIFSIGSSGQKLENMQSTYTDFFKFALYKKISFLDQTDCTELITKPVEGVLVYQPEAVQRIYQVSAGHPYFTQLVCHELFSMCQKTGVRDIQRADVDAVLVSVIERGTVNLKFVWDEADDLEKWVLACLARSPECSELSTLTDTLRGQRVRFSETDLIAALVHMQEKDVLTDKNQFVVELLRLWLRQNRPLERVREELVEVSPIANRYTEIGEEYWEQGQRENALESFRQALEVDPGNVKARVSLGILLLEAGELEAAASAFENALVLDGEDVAALGGYCQVQLALGDRTRNEGDVERAMGYYQAVLAVNPEHKTARERLADLYSRKAEAELVAGQDEAALLAYQTALDFTPEDADLAARVEQVMAAKKADAVFKLTNRAEDAQANGDWEAAIAALQDALIITGEDVALEKKLAQVKASQRAHLLATLPDQARHFEAQEEWEKAIQVWKAYLALYPEDQGPAGEALENAQEMQAIQTKYANAQAALERKDHQQAIELLQQIVQADPGYKNASRMLASAVGSSRRKQVNLLRRSWYALPIVFILITAAAYFGLRDRVQLPVITLTQATATHSSETGATIPIITVTSVPSPTPTPSPEWVTEFAEPLLAEIEGKPPQFEDDFSSIEQTWAIPEGSTPNEYWVDGALHLKGSNPQVNLYIDTTDFIVKFQFKPEYPVSTYFQTFLSESLHFDFDLENNNYYFVHSGSTTDPWLSSKHSWGGGNLTRELTIIRKDEKLAIYLDGRPLTAHSDIPAEMTEISLKVTSGDGMVEVDNFRLWDLSTLEGESITQDTSTPALSATPFPEWVTDFAEPILNNIAERPPDFEDDFSTPIQEPGYLVINGQDADVSDYVTEGKLELEGQFDMALGSQQFNAYDFALQYEAELYNTKNLGEMGIHIFDGLYVFNFNPISGNWTIKKADDWPGPLNIDTGRIEDEIGTRVEILLLVKGDKIAVYLNDEPLTFVQVLFDVENDINQIIISSYGEQFHATIDNVKFWKLDE